MARTRRRTPVQRRRRSKGAPAWLWALLGLFGGLSIAYVTWLVMQPAGTDTTSKTRKALDKPVQHDTRDVRKTPGKPIPPPPRPRFDFYNLLPEMEVVVPEQEIRGTPTREGVKRVEQPGTYLLQAGSFPSHERADRLRAKLALLGLETRIQTVSVDGNRTWHRVRVGPYKNLADLNEARTLLKKNGIDAILIRLTK
ncbi:sporulation related protein [Thiogranum longum]|uniref:Sporulation related protein n=1 Tax=Thiogranum longum TaxID=1537524 RepID=A0A4R1HIF8_9GAMM|nr:SPOR domain-containing protein [Thiogranum longum]TCK16992.1 sporulation related protein [Thiogranum longum]